MIEPVILGLKGRLSSGETSQQIEPDCWPICRLTNKVEVDGAPQENWNRVRCIFGSGGE
jgi:hypothetical protein